MKHQTSTSFASLLLLGFAPASVLAKTFSLTELFYHPAADHEAMCKQYFGANAVKADYDIDLKPMGETELQTTLSSLNIGVTRNEFYYFVTHNLDEAPTGTTDEAYFFENNGGAAPSFFDPVDSSSLGINLGVTDKYGRVLCKVETAVTPTRRLSEVNHDEEGNQGRQEQNGENKEDAEPKKESLARKLRSKLSWGW